MKLLAAIFTLLVAILFLGAAYSGYSENARISSTHIGTYPDKFAAPPSVGGLNIQQAEEQGRLATAGLEGLLGLVLVFAAIVLCGPAERSTNSAEYNLRQHPSRDQVSAQLNSRTLAENRQPITDALAQRGRPAYQLQPSGRARVEELRQQLRNRPTNTAQG